MIKKTFENIPAKRALIIGVLAAVTQLQGCFPVIVAGAAVGTLAATDRRTLGAQTEDSSIGLRAGNRLDSRFGSTNHIVVTSYNRKILLTGEVADQATKDEAEKIAAGVENVIAVINELEIGAPSSFRTRSNDTLLTTKVRATFIDAKDVFANAFRIKTERGIVYLMGRVTEREGERAAELTRGISGVAKVVKVFDYLSEDELKQMSTMQTK